MKLDRSFQYLVDNLFTYRIRYLSTTLKSFLSNNLISANNKQSSQDKHCNLDSVCSILLTNKLYTARKCLISKLFLYRYSALLVEMGPTNFMYPLYELDYYRRQQIYISSTYLEGNSQLRSVHLNLFTKQSFLYVHFLFHAQDSMHA